MYVIVFNARNQRVLHYCSRPGGKKQLVNIINAQLVCTRRRGVTRYYYIITYNDIAVRVSADRRRLHQVSTIIIIIHAACRL